MTSPIDQAHCDLIYGLAVSLKPTSVLELGYGQGASFRALWKALTYNEINCRYTLLDDWRAHSGKPAPELKGLPLEILSMSEAEFYNDHAKPCSYDLILSDADHGHAHEWFSQSLDMLRSPGLLIYHDAANPDHPNMGDLDLTGLSFLIFNKSSRPEENCERGLLVIFRT
jgi:predicted O-methyltransferase YrrM